MYSSLPGIPPVAAYTYAQESTRVQHSNCDSSTRTRYQSGTCSHLLESPHPERYRYCPSCRTREAHTRCPSMNLKDKSVAATRLTATMNHHSHPAIGANPGDSALVYVASWSSSKVLMDQRSTRYLPRMNSTPHPFASPSVKYRLASSERRLQVSIKLATRPY